MDDLIKRLRDGLVEYDKRWSGDTHSDKGGPVDYDATDALMSEAAAALAEAQAEIARLRGEIAEWQVAGQYADDQLRRLGSDGYASGLTGLLARAGA